MNHFFTKPMRLFFLRPIRSGVRFTGVIVLAAVLAAAGCGSQKTDEAAKPAPLTAKPNRVIGLGRIEPELRILELTAEVSGIITRLAGRAGDRVAQGQTIVELSQAIELARVDQAAAQVEAQASQVESAKAGLASARIKGANAKVVYERAKSLYEQNAQAKADADNAQAEYESLLEDIKRLEAEVLKAQNQLKQSRADLRYAQAVLAQRSIKSLSAGQVLSLDVTLGSLVSPGQSFGTFAPDSPLIARCEVDEMFAAEVKIGLRGFVRNQGQTEPLAWGKVAFVGPGLRKKSLFSDEVGDLEDRRVREVWIALDAGAGLLLGSRVEGVVLLEE